MTETSFNYNKLTCDKVLSGHHGSVNCLIQLTSGLLASAADDSSIKIWNPTTGELLHTLEEHFSRVTCLTELPEGILASGSFDTSIRLWNVSTAKCILQLNAHDAWVLDLLLLNDKRLCSCSGDKTIKIWNIYKKTCAMTFKGHKAVINMIIQAKSNDIISCSEDKTVKVWSIVKGECIKSISFTTSVNVLYELNNGQILIGTNNSIQVLESSNVIEVDVELSSRLCEIGNEGVIAYGNENGELIIVDVNDKDTIFTVCIRCTRRLPVGRRNCSPSTKRDLAASRRFPFPWTVTVRIPS